LCVAAACKIIIINNNNSNKNTNELKIKIKGFIALKTGHIFNK